MQSQQLELFIYLLVVNARMISPGQCTSLASGEVLHSVEAERGEVGNRTHHLSSPLGTKCMGTVGHYDNSSKTSLQVVVGAEQVLFALNRSQHLLIVTGNTCQVYWYDGLRPLVDSICHLVVVHLQRIFLSIYKSEGSSDVAYHTCCSRIGVGRGDDLVARTDTQQLQD